MEKEKIIKVKPRNVYDICRFLDENYSHVGYGGGLNVIEKLYLEGISFRTIDKNYFLKNSPRKSQLIIKAPRKFNKETLSKLIKMAAN